MLYDVHLFPLVRVKVRVEADDQTKAIERAEGQASLHRIFDKDMANDGAVLETEYAEEISHYLVDETNDDDYMNSHWYAADGKTYLNNEKDDSFELLSQLFNQEELRDIILRAKKKELPTMFGRSDSLDKHLERIIKEAD